LQELKAFDINEIRAGWLLRSTFPKVRGERWIQREPSGESQRSDDEQNANGTGQLPMVRAVKRDRQAGSRRCADACPEQHHNKKDVENKGQWLSTSLNTQQVNLNPLVLESALNEWLGTTGAF
jgi:hypothetical protein